MKDLVLTVQRRIAGVIHLKDASFLLGMVFEGLSRPGSRERAGRLAALATLLRVVHHIGFWDVG